MTSTRDRFEGDASSPSEEGEVGNAPGKRTLTAGMLIQRKLSRWVQRLVAAAQPTARTAPAGETAAVDDPFGMHLSPTAPAVQRVASGAEPSIDAGLHAAAERGISGAASTLPHDEAIQRSFGRHDVSGIVAHTDGAAVEGAHAMGAQAFASGNHVAFAGAPDLHTAAHEAAHVIQQRAGVALKGGIGSEGDDYERHADAVADAVVAGRSAEALLDGSPTGGGAAVQMKIGAGKGTGTKVRNKGNGETGVIVGPAAWGQYTVKWDSDGKQTLVKGDDDEYEVVTGTTEVTPPVTTATPPVTTTTPPVTTTTPPVTTTTPPTTTTTPPTTTTTPPTTTTTPPTTGGKAPDQDIDHFDDEEFQRQWKEKQDEVYAAMQEFVPRFQALDGKAEVRVRGSIATGVKANPNKVDKRTGKRLLFNPTDFDIDAYVASDKLYQAALDESGLDDDECRGQIPGSKLSSVNAIIKDMRVALAEIAGNRDAPKPLRYRFNVLIRSVRNDRFTVRKDQNDMGGPMTIYED